MLYFLVLLAAASALVDAKSVHPFLEVSVPRIKDSRIIGGVDAAEGQYKYIVSLNYQGDGHACGASILSADYVLTAAHCCLTGSAMEIYAGSIYLSKGGTKYPISQYIYHGDYQPDSHWKNDICVIKLASPIQLGANAEQVMLPPQGMEVNSGDKLTIIGWGTDENGNGPDRLKVLDNDPAMSNSECIAKTNVDIYAGQLCTFAGNGHATCSGDSGGPLTRNGVQVGLTSWGYMPCGTVNMPDVFTRVPYYIDWIKQVMGSSAKDLKFAAPEDLL